MILRTTPEVKSVELIWEQISTVMYTILWGTGRPQANAVSNLYTANELNQYVAISNSQSQQLMYDNDGNLTNDGVFAFSWNGENRLMKMETTDAATNAGVLKVKCEFAYDYMGRRFRKTVGSDYSGGTYATTNVTTFVYDGWNLIAATETTVADTNMTYFVNGLDLSGSLQGAGGIGGLLAVIEDDGGTYFPAFDGNGNVTEYVDTNGTIVAHREYSPFGQTIAATGTKKNDFAHWFSTKYEDAETGLYYYGYRFYCLNLARWPSRDPIEEYGFVSVFLKDPSESWVGRSRRSVTARLYTQTHRPSILGRFVPTRFALHNNGLSRFSSESTTPNEYSYVENQPFDIDFLGLTIYVCGTPDAFGIPGFRHAYIWDDENPGDCCGTSGSSGYETGTGCGNDPDGDLNAGRCEAVELPSDYQDSWFMEDVCECVEDMDDGPWLPFVRDCHSQLEDCFGAVPYPGVPGGRVGR